MSDDLPAEEFRWTEARMQLALTANGALFDYIRYCAVPNIDVIRCAVPHECDLLILPVSRAHFIEVEIKTSANDLVRDFKKRKHVVRENYDYQELYQSAIGSMWYAVPTELVEKAVAVVHSRYGIVEVGRRWHERLQKWYTTTEIVRLPKPLKCHRPSDEQVIAFLRRGVIRMWTGDERRLVEGYSG